MEYKNKIASLEYELSLSNDENNKMKQINQELLQ